MYIDHGLYTDKLVNRFIRHADVEEAVLRFRNIAVVNVIGQSVNGLDIYCVEVGTGPIKILIWSQMHGDEPTGTLAILDLFNFFAANDEHNSTRRKLLDTCTFHFVPMLNPDGAELMQRRNAQGLDINRDFVALQTPEGLALKNLQQQIKPHFAFNLHNQHSLWSVSGTKKPATISMLAPPFNPAADESVTRLKAIKVVACLKQFFDAKIPGQIGRWSDEYEPRAFGDGFQGLGTATVLIESGGYPNDAAMAVVRKLNFEAILHAAMQISSGAYEHQLTDVYYGIPKNSKEIFHLKLTNVKLFTTTGIIGVDIGLNYTELIDNESKGITQIYTLADLGDLSTWGAYQMIDADGAIVKGSLEMDKNPTFELTLKDRLIYFDNGIFFSKNA